jgi:hypothetical protein
VTAPDPVDAAAAVPDAKSGVAPDPGMRGLGDLLSPGLPDHAAAMAALSSCAPPGGYPAAQSGGEQGLPAGTPA